MFFEAQDHTSNVRTFNDVQAYMVHLLANFDICTTQKLSTFAQNRSS